MGYTETPLLVDVDSGGRDDAGSTVTLGPDSAGERTDDATLTMALPPEE